MVKSFLTHNKKGPFCYLIQGCQLWRVGRGGFPVRLDPIEVRKRQLTTSSFRTWFQIETRLKKNVGKIVQTKIPVFILGKIQVRSTTLHPLLRTLKGCVTTFPTSLDPNFMRNRQLSTSSFRICFQIEKQMKTCSQNLYQTKMPGMASGRPM